MGRFIVPVTLQGLCLLLGGDWPLPPHSPAQRVTGLGSGACCLPCPPASCQPCGSKRQVPKGWSGGLGLPSAQQARPGLGLTGGGDGLRRVAGSICPSLLTTARGPPVGSHAPGRVAVVGEGQVPHAQLIERPQDSQTAVNGVAALHTDQAGHLPFPEGLPDACGESRGAGEWAPGVWRGGVLISTCCSG